MTVIVYEYTWELIAPLSNFLVFYCVCKGCVFCPGCWFIASFAHFSRRRIKSLKNV